MRLDYIFDYLKDFACNFFKGAIFEIEEIIVPSENNAVKTFKVIFQFMRSYTTEIKMKMLKIFIQNGSNS